MKTKTNQLLVPTKDIGQYSYVSSNGNKLFFTSSTSTVSCCDMNGKEIWRFEGISLLRSPRGVVVDHQGFAFAAGEKSRNIVVISVDGNSQRRYIRFQVQEQCVMIKVKMKYLCVTQTGKHPGSKYL